MAGIVSDANGAVLPGAALTATDTNTGLTFTAMSNSHDEYRISQLPPAVYTLTVDMQGFKKYEGTKITVEVGVIANGFRCRAAESSIRESRWGVR